MGDWGSLLTARFRCSNPSCKPCCTVLPATTSCHHLALGRKQHQDRNGPGFSGMRGITCRITEELHPRFHASYVSPPLSIRPLSRFRSRLAIQDPSPSVSISISIGRNQPLLYPLGAQSDSQNPPGEQVFMPLITGNYTPG